MSSLSFPRTLHYTAPDSLPPCQSGTECCICLDDLGTAPSVIVKACAHAFHQECMSNCLSNSNACPVCRSPIGEPQGKSPSGTMTVTRRRTKCPGFGTSSLQIDYYIPNGTQESYHDHPGQFYSGATRTAYLPDNPEGQQLLYRLQYSFMHGLIFRVGTSLTTHQDNVTTWTSIHHKTSLSGGTHGFPDPLYLDNCNESLDALNVPKSCPPQHDSLTYTAPNKLQTCLLSSLDRYHVPPTASPPQGQCPSARMKLERLAGQPTPGFAGSASTIRIKYNIPAGIQKDYHPNPGQPYPDTSRVCYLPDTAEGQGLLRRLCFAFEHGLIFHVGTSFTTQRDNQVVWGSIPHKTSLTGGEFGFPDASYVTTCHGKLDECGVPPADQCPY